jgi:hypothetical protein
MLNRHHRSPEDMKQWATAAALKAASAFHPVLYGSKAVNLYLPPAFEFEASDVDILLLVPSEEVFDTTIADIKREMQSLLQAWCESTFIRISALTVFHNLQPTIKIAVNGIHIADFTRQFYTVPLPEFQYKTVEVLYNSDCFPMQVINLEDILHRLTATVHCQSYADGGLPQDVSRNQWRITKDGKRLDRLMFLRSHSMLLVEPRTLQLNVLPYVCNTAMTVQTAISGLKYAMPVGVVKPPINLKISVPTAFPFEEVAFKALACYDSRLLTLQNTIKSVKEKVYSRRTIMKHIKIIKSDWRKLKSNTRKELFAFQQDMVMSMGKLVEALCDVRKTDKKEVRKPLSLFLCRSPFLTHLCFFVFLSSHSV